MKAVVVLTLVALLMAAPTVAADGPVDNPCDGYSTKQCAVGLVGGLFGPCGPLVDNVQECPPDS